MLPPILNHLIAGEGLDLHHWHTLLEQWTGAAVWRHGMSVTGNIAIQHMLDRAANAGILIDTDGHWRLRDTSQHGVEELRNFMITADAERRLGDELTSKGQRACNVRFIGDDEWNTDAE